MTKRQFRVLYREFLFRMVDLEVLSAHALGDSHKLLGQFAVLLVFFSIWMGMAAFGFAGMKTGPAEAFLLTLITGHFLISTTMLVIGLFAVLSWDSTFPSRRDVFVLAPLPVRARTMFLAKVAAAATALALTVALLHGAMGLVWPLAFELQAAPQTAPALTVQPAQAPVSAANLQTVMDRDMPKSLDATDGIVIGVIKHGDRHIFSYGAAQTDAIFEIGSLSKTFTALILARMAEQGKVRLNQPVRELLPAGTTAKPIGKEITLLDVATHHAGLPANPDYFQPRDLGRPFGDDRSADVYALFAKHGVAAPPDPSYRYSNLGFGLLGLLLSDRAGVSYPALVRQEVAVPLGLHDTAAGIQPEQQARYAQGYAAGNQPVPPMFTDAMSAAGGIRSTASDLLTYLEANLHPEKAGALAGAIRETQRLRAEASAGSHIGLAWHHRDDSGTYFHTGRTQGFTSSAFFNPAGDYAAVILLNHGPFGTHSLDLIDEHVRQRLSGEPALALATVYIPASKGFTGVLRWYAAYWLTMLAAASFIYCGVLTVQGCAAQLLPRRLFLRVSGLLQMAAFCLFVTGYFLQPVFGSIDSLDSPQTRRLLMWIPSYWFLGLFHQLNGSMYAPLEPLAHRAWIGLGVTVCGAAIAYALSYLRTLRRIVEEPDITPGVRTLNWLPPFGSRPQTAIAQFAIRTLSRSRQHRVILAFYLGIGLALTIFLLRTPEMRNQADTPLLASSVVMLALAMIGTRVVFAFPLDLRANWIFQVVGLRSGAGCVAASRRSLLVLSALPVWLVSAVVCFRLWPWRQAAGHLALLALLAMIVADMCLFRFRKVPFACSYLPGKSQVNMVFLGALGLMYGVMGCVKLERAILLQTGSTLAMLACFAAFAVCLRLVTRALDDEGLKFEEARDPVVLELKLSG